MVASSLPRDTTSWAETGFVQIETLAGQPNVYVPMREPNLAVSCWAVGPNSNKAPWNLANNLAEHILAACQDHRACNRVVELPGDYPAVRVHQAWPLTEPRRMYGDDGAYARFVFDMAMAWVELR